MVKIKRKRARNRVPGQDSINAELLKEENTVLAHRSGRGLEDRINISRMGRGYHMPNT